MLQMRRKSLKNWIWISKCVLRRDRLFECNDKGFFPICFRLPWDTMFCPRKKGKFPSLWRLILSPRIVMEYMLTGNSRFTSTLGKPFVSKTFYRIWRNWFSFVGELHCPKSHDMNMEFLQYLLTRKFSSLLLKNLNIEHMMLPYPQSVWS